MAPRNKYYRIYYFLNTLLRNLCWHLGLNSYQTTKHTSENATLRFWINTSIIILYHVHRIRQREIIQRVWKQLKQTASCWHPIGRGYLINVGYDRYPIIFTNYWRLRLIWVPISIQACAKYTRGNKLEGATNDGSHPWSIKGIHIHGMK